MNQEERMLKILNYLETHTFMNTQDICSLFGVSRDTARRDQVKLAERNLVARTHGGVTLPERHRLINPCDHFESRMEAESLSKRRIGGHAASFVSDGDVVFLDISTTVHSISQSLQAEGITAVTNSIDTAYYLAQNKHISIHMLGGVLNHSTRHVNGYAAFEKLRDYRFDIAFLSCACIRKDGLYYGHEEDIYFKRELVKVADKIILVFDHTKVDAHANFRAFDLTHINTVITDRQLPENISSELAKNKCTVIDHL
ncbi:DeoR/GlpR family DNA-binding transcription regulator [Bacillus sp. 1P06AnD]|uniref:DeoR/GlpR family DNA-binding transcription regulator n=1 Tax=Bacillus sp. 1P06AnD TaxID=3132208 RepID=UPI00399F4182